ncbi:hypothetical protein NEOLI_002012 [Neolecta irregularis DAH-3]|uniref:Uncharacterized protein n=1 Tax=Neolecta irregularis (strain DAH-3) TaxID=1198029 RepID=A0A1U7LKF1_NEOID|nr:hypothetical protein NEOLI_002012 [Neolecta irregularis DAH-3]|eukprot:OLL23127.1 hypothetical protein NEOLI_002012 [Neolecta irregularis DAH-3]
MPRVEQRETTRGRLCVEKMMEGGEKVEREGEVLYLGDELEECLKRAIRKQKKDLIYLGAAIQRMSHLSIAQYQK